MHENSAVKDGVKLEIQNSYFHPFFTIFLLTFFSQKWKKRYMHLVTISFWLTANVSTEGTMKKFPFWADFDQIQRIACNWMGSTCIDLKIG
jgi:hypothetical protein